MFIRNFVIIFAAAIYLVSCSNETKQPSTEENTPPATEEVTDLGEYKGKGLNIAVAGFKSLGGQLKAALKEGGVQHAVEYCKVSASPILDSLSEEYNAKIKRTSLKLRNGKNAPTPEESKILKQFESNFILGKPSEPVIEDRGAYGIHFYSPIHIQKACLQCHGVPGETMTEKDSIFITEQYKFDKATGYKEGDFRGIWSVEFKN